MPDEPFFALSVDLLCVAGFDGYFKRLNPRWSELLGWTTQELTGRPGVVSSRFAAGKFESTRGILHDVAARYRNEQRTRELADRLAAVVNTAVDAIATIDTRGIIESANPAVQALFGFEPGGAGYRGAPERQHRLRVPADGRLSFLLAAAEKRGDLIVPGRAHRTTATTKTDS